MTEQVKVTKAFISGDGSFERVRKEDEPLFDLASRQSAISLAEDLGTPLYYEPPYDPAALALLMTVDITHFRCVKTKAADCAGIGHQIERVDEKKPVPEASIMR